MKGVFAWSAVLINSRDCEVSQIKVQGLPAAFWEAVGMTLVLGCAGEILAGLELPSHKACRIPFRGLR